MGNTMEDRIAKSNRSSKNQYKHVLIFHEIATRNTNHMVNPMIDEDSYIDYDISTYGFQFGFGMTQVIFGIILLCILLFFNRSNPVKFGLFNPETLSLTGYGKASVLYTISILLGIISLALFGTLFSKSKKFNPEDHID